MMDAENNNLEELISNTETTALSHGSSAVVAAISTLSHDADSGAPPLPEDSSTPFKHRLTSRRRLQKNNSTSNNSATAAVRTSSSFSLEDAFATSSLSLNMTVVAPAKRRHNSLETFTIAKLRFDWLVEASFGKGSPTTTTSKRAIKNNSNSKTTCPRFGL